MPRGHAFLRRPRGLGGRFLGSRRGREGQEPHLSGDLGTMFFTPESGLWGQRRAEEPRSPEPRLPKPASLESQRGDEPNGASPPNPRPRGGRKSSSRAARACRPLSRVLNSPRGRQRRAPARLQPPGRPLCPPDSCPVLFPAAPKPLPRPSSSLLRPCPPLSGRIHSAGARPRVPTRPGSEEPLPRQPPLGASAAGLPPPPPPTFFFRSRERFLRFLFSSLSFCS